MLTKTKPLIIIFFLICSNSRSFSQQEELNPLNMSRIGEVLPPSPNASSLGRFGGVPLNLSTGSPNISIPLHTLSTSNLSVPISLQYTTSGFQIDELASRVGLSWSLNIGGVITRSVADGPDESSQRLTIPIGFYSGASTTDIYNYLDDNNQSVYDLTDVQPDIFSFNFGNYQGKFIINDDEIVMLSNSNIVVRTSLIETSFIDGCHFKITTPDGVIYYFGGNDAFESSGSVSTGDNCNSEKDFPVSETAWFLKKIIHPNGDLITFSYSAVSQNYPYSIHQTETRKVRLSEEIPCPNDFDPTSYNYPFPAYTNSTCITTIYNFGRRLDEIQTSSGQKITIDYRTRTDLPQDFLIDKINVHHFNSSQVWKTYNFQYDEIASNEFTNVWNQNEQALKVRPFLKSVTEKDNTQESSNQKYSFLYTDLTGLPARLSYSRDYWGYFNGKDNTTTVYLLDDINNLNSLYVLFNASADRTPNSIYSQKGLLKKIIYPTGGYEEIFYEGHSYKANETIVHEDPQLVSINGFIDQPSANPVIKESAQFIPNKSQSASFTVFANYYGENVYDYPVDRVAYSIYDVTNSTYAFSEQEISAGDGIPNEINHQVLLVAGHAYKIIIKMYGFEVAGVAELTYVDEESENITHNKSVGGVRISKLITRSSEESAAMTKKLHYVLLNDFDFSSCDFVDYYFDNFERSIRTADCSYPMCQFANVIYYTLSSSTYNNISPFSNRHIAYRSVLESYGENFENGFTENIFNLAPDIPTTYKYGTSPLRSAFTSGEYLQGLPKSKTEYSKLDNAFVKKREEITSYKMDSRVNIDFPAYTIRKNFEIPCYSNPSAIIRDVQLFDVREYQVPRRWVYPDTVIRRIYSSEGSQFVETKINYEHTNVTDVNPSSVSTIDSKGEKITLKTKSANELFTTAQPQWLENLKQKGCSECPVEQIKIEKINGNDYVVSGQLFIYHNSILKPEEIYQLDIASPIPINQFILSNVNNGSFVFDARYNISERFQYSTSNGNLLSKHNMNSGMIQSFLWGYNNQYPVASIINTTYDIAKTYITQSILDNPVDDATLRSHLTNLRSIPGTQVTTYTYKPLVGISSATDPNGRNSFYEYDSFGRLKNIKDHDNNVVKVVDYKYQEQQ